jgi:hypothetical protein
MAEEAHWRGRSGRRWRDISRLEHTARRGRGRRLPLAGSLGTCCGRLGAACCCACCGLRLHGRDRGLSSGRHQCGHLGGHVGRGRQGVRHARRAAGSVLRGGRNLLAFALTALDDPHWRHARCCVQRAAVSCGGGCDAPKTAALRSTGGWHGSARDRPRKGRAAIARSDPTEALPASRARLDHGNDFAQMAENQMWPKTKLRVPYVF